MAQARITIVGLGLIGNSIGLGLSQEKRDFQIVGHDKDNDAATLARKMKTVDKTDWNLINACEGADLVILALPAPAIRETLEAVAGELKPGCVILDTASIKEPVLDWAHELLPDTVHFVGTNPVVSPVESGGAAARADLFQNAAWAICPLSTTHELAVKTAADLAERLGSNPLFLEAAEHDGMMAAVDHLPAVVSAVLLSSLLNVSTWREMRKLAGLQFDDTTRAISIDPLVFRNLLLANPDNLSHWIDTYIENLKAWRELIQTGDIESISAKLEAALEGRERWEKQRSTGNWEEGDQPIPQRRSWLAEMLGFGSLLSRRARKEEREA